MPMFSDFVIKWCLDPICCIQSVHSMMFSPCGAEHLSLCIQNCVLLESKFHCSLTLGRNINSRTCIFKTTVPFYVVWAKCSPMVMP